MATVTSWGKNETGWWPSALQEVDVSVISNEECKHSWNFKKPSVTEYVMRYVEYQDFLNLDTNCSSLLFVYSYLVLASAQRMRTRASARVMLAVPWLSGMMVAMSLSAWQAGGWTVLVTPLMCL